MTRNISLYMEVYFSLCKTMYNKNIYSHYTRRRIMKIFVSIIQEDV